MRGIVLRLLLVVVAPGIARADVVEGEIAIGYRNVSVDGSRAKYDQDVNLDDGARLFDLRLSIRPDDASPLTPDAVTLDARNLGGDPFEQLRLDVRKYGRYAFRANRRRSAWFYDDILVLPADASIEGSTGGDFHRFDVERVHDDVSLTIEATERAQFVIGFDRQRKTGESTTTLDISRDEFELDAPVDETLETWRIGARYRWPSLRLSLDERIRDYASLGERFLPGFSVGENPGDLTTVDFYFLDEPYRFRSYEHTATVHFEPGQRFRSTARILVGDLDLDTDVEERSGGIDFMGNPFSTDIAGGGSIERESTAQSLDLSYSVTDRIDLIAGLRHRSLDQVGAIDFGTAEGGTSRWDIENQAYDLGIAVAPRDDLTLAAGWRRERRDLFFRDQQAGADPVTEAERSDADLFYATLDYRPMPGLGVSLSLNDRQIDDPFSLATPADARRFRIRARWKGDNGFSAVVSHLHTTRDNDVAQWSHDSSQTSLRIAYSSESLLVSAGTTRADVDRDYMRLVTGGFRQDLFDVAYSADTSYDDLLVRWSARERLDIGAALRRYDNDGSFPVQRDDFRLFASIGIAEGYVLDLSWREIDYEEAAIEAYDAGLFEAVLRLGF